jgi:hypothetical protein
MPMGQKASPVRGEYLGERQHYVARISGPLFSIGHFEPEKDGKNGAMTVNPTSICQMTFCPNYRFRILMPQVTVLTDLRS